MAALTENVINRILSEKQFHFAVKPEQFKIIESIVNKRDTFAVLSTGFGKSICYVIPALYYDEINPCKKHTSLVISPLKALIKDQVQTLKDHNIKACGIYEGVDKSVVDEIKNGDATVLLASPEAIISKHWLRVLQDVYKDNIALVAYDEAHCISEWGLDFREDYRKVGILQSVLNSPVLTLTATCNTAMKADIEKILGMSQVNTISFLPNRSNIFINIQKSSEKYEDELQWLLTNLRRKGIAMNKTLLYVNSIGKCEELYIWMHGLLKEKAYDGQLSVDTRMVEMFHAHTDTKSKDRILSTFCSEGGTIRILICTVAVGMGINIPDVSIVLIWGLPPSLLQLWQEAGRAGRDGRSSISVCYAYPRSIALPCDSCRKSGKRKCDCARRTYLRELVSTTECQRYHILHTFSLSDENKSELKDLMKMNNTCCSCENLCNRKLCKCCITCVMKCKCSNRKKSSNEVILSFIR
ncbi:bifunctional 3'-5' exonuclease/ATP-dependent helicase WRN-like [Ostrea edulis]|uniref:bifunctional 3'-5' exonuclease/ATP-dependent helicase WRN-like n=1 Tax=Ostrea edulis TaxID=37623 RepID=UPI0024AFD932|nr:bifunctional 3'-5' exonuclease/ATP-dependent helicase WRN-like [Ostrea edulis]